MSEDLKNLVKISSWNLREDYIPLEEWQENRRCRGRHDNRTVMGFYTCTSSRFLWLWPFVEFESWHIITALEPVSLRLLCEGRVIAVLVVRTLFPRIVSETSVTFTGYPEIAQASKTSRRQCSGVEVDSIKYPYSTETALQILIYHGSHKNNIQRHWLPKWVEREEPGR